MTQQGDDFDDVGRALTEQAAGLLTYHVTDDGLVLTAPDDRPFEVRVGEDRRAAELRASLAQLWSVSEHEEPPSTFVMERAAYDRTLSVGYEEPSEPEPAPRRRGRPIGDRLGRRLGRRRST